MLHMLPFRIAGRTVRALTRLERSHAFCSRAQMRILRIETLIRGNPFSFDACSRGLHLRPPLQERLTTVLTPLIQQRCLPTLHAHSQKEECLVVNKCVFASAFPTDTLSRQGLRQLFFNAPAEKAKKCCFFVCFLDAAGGKLSLLTQRTAA